MNRNLISVGIILSLFFINKTSAQSYAEIFESIQKAIQDSESPVVLDSLLEKSYHLAYSESYLADSILILVTDIAQELNSKKEYGLTKRFLVNIENEIIAGDQQHILWLKLLDEMVIAYGYSGQWDTCRMILDKGVSILQEQHLNDSFPQFYTNLGYAKNLLGESPIDDYLLALDLARKKKDLKVQISALNNISRAYRREEDMEKSIEYSLQSLELTKQNQIPVRAFQVVNMAELYTHNGESDKALVLYRNYESNFQSDVNERRVFYFGWGEQYIYKSLDNALGHYYTDLALSASSNFRTSKLMANKAFLYALAHEFDKALEWQIRAMEDFYEIQWPFPSDGHLLDTKRAMNQFWYVYKYAQILYFKNLNAEQVDVEELSKAVEYNGQALDMLYYFQSRLNKEEKSRFTGYIRMCTELGAEMDHLLFSVEQDSVYLTRIIKQSDVVKSLETVSQKKKKTLGEQDAQLKLLFEKEDQYFSDLMQLKSRSDESHIDGLSQYLLKKQEIDEIQKEISHHFPGINSYAHDQLDISEIQNNLQSDEMIINYFIVEYKYHEKKDGLYTMLITDSDIQILKSENIDGLEAQIDSLQYSIVSQGTEYGTYLTRISKQLLDPIAPYLNMKKLIILSDKYLSDLPFELLWTSAKQYLLVDHEIRYAPSLQILLRKKEVSSEGMLAMVPQVGDHLSGALSELKYLESEFEGAFLSGREATEAAFKESMQSYAILHISTHGILNERYSEDSYLYFDTLKDDEEDGRLYVDEISYLSIPAALVVLGACNSGNGRMFGDGVMSLSKSFLNAGSQNVMCGLWPLEDQSTAAVLKLFYNNLSSGQNPSSALRNAKLDFLTSAPASIKHPYFWAGLLLSGLNDEPFSEQLLIHQPVIGTGIMLMVGIVLAGLLFLLFRRRWLLFQ